MNRQIFTWEIPLYRLKSKELWWEWFYVLILFCAAIFLFSLNLGALPLRDWDEGTFAQVAKEIYESSFSHWHWLFPTIWQEPYLNKPPLIHSLTAVVYNFLGVSEFSTRIIGATLTASSVPLLYLLARELFLPRYYALFSSLAYLTMMPVIRHGRLAMLDGATLCFQLLLFLFLLKTRRDLRWAFPVGLSLALICLTKGWMMGVLLGAIAFLFLLWDTPRLLTSFYLWSGIILGVLPVVAWYAAQYLYYGETFIHTAIQEQSLNRVFTAVEGNQGAVWYYLVELIKYPYPWIFLALWGFKLAWENLNWSWSKFILISSSIYLIVISLMGTKLPWYVMPIYPSLALAVGVALGEVKSLPSYISYPSAWKQFFSLLTVAIMGGFIYFAITKPEDQHLLTIFILLFITFLSVTILLRKKDQQFIPVLFWGMFVSLMVFFSSNHWLWELNEAFAVKPVANLVNEFVPKDKKVYINFDYERPSLNFYSERQVTAINEEELKQLIKSPNYLLVNHKILESLNLVSDNDNIYCNLSDNIPEQSTHSFNCFEAVTKPKSNFTLLKPIQ
ncbi:glycosyltransferase family 39 protein [Cyanobacterium aponinum FACHB-4101]|uniref:ArnT family glycosyltransferase n=1 Tax=Cyanobacterium aponinum TaxID=379064 RepID=UPI00167FE838|nr:glycosyltransferase family 39 protein [Cyanobacterium aponinum]MBD2395791.1 glycosyltransferase family 39 protein [Cyanobacterium aponinum FACHB-4101]